MEGAEAIQPTPPTETQVKQAEGSGTIVPDNSPVLPQKPPQTVQPILTPTEDLDEQIQANTKRKKRRKKREQQTYSTRTYDIPEVYDEIAQQRYAERVALGIEPPPSKKKQMAIQTSLKPNQQPPQVKKEHILNPFLLEPQSDFDVIAKQKRIAADSPMRPTLKYNPETGTQDIVYVPEIETAKPTAMNIPSDQAQAIYNSMYADILQEYGKLLDNLPTISDAVLEGLVMSRDSFPYEVRMEIIKEYKVRTNYYDRRRNPQKYQLDIDPNLLERKE